jgi:hypothetical protein
MQEACESSLDGSNGEGGRAEPFYEIIVRVDGWVTLLPSHADVWFGRGKPIKEHPGNLALGVLVKSLLLRYNACNGKKVKRLVSQEVINKSKSRGGNFVK